MLPIQSLFPRVVLRLLGVALLVLLAGMVGRADAKPLPKVGVEKFRDLLDAVSNISEDEPSGVAEQLTRSAKDLRAAANEGTLYLGELTQILLLQEWGISELSDLDDAKVDLSQVKEAVSKQDGETFRRQVQGLLAMAATKSTVIQMIKGELKKSVRQALLDRLDKGVRYYLASAKPLDRIAAANLIGQTMSEARQRGNADVLNAVGEPIRKVITQDARNLRQRLRKFGDDLRKLTTDSNAAVQVASVRALSNLEESELAATVATLQPLLDPAQGVLVRRATAAGLAHMVDIVYQQWNAGEKAGAGRRVEPSLKTLVQIFPAATRGLSDLDLEVRRSCLLACERTVITLDDMVGTRKVPVGSSSVYRPMAETLKESLPKLNGIARGTDPDLRLTACQLLETLVGIWPKLPHAKETLPKPNREPVKEKEPAKGVPLSLPLSSIRGSRRSVTTRPSQWAAARAEPPSRTTLLPPVPLRDPPPTPAVTLDRPVRLSSSDDVFSDRPVCVSVRPAAFVVPAAGDLPPPRKLSLLLQQTIEARIAGLSDPDYRVRLASVDVLEMFVVKTAEEQAAPVVPDLVEGLSKKGLSDPNKFVRWSSARTLGRLAHRLEPQQTKEVVRGLANMLNDREDQRVRITAAEAIAKYGALVEDQEVVRHLAGVINRGDKEYILAILNTIQEIGTAAQPALPNVAWIVSNRNLPTSVRVEAARTLSRFGSYAKGQLEALRKVMVNDPSEEVRNAASDAVLAIDRPK